MVHTAQPHGSPLEPVRCGAPPRRRPFSLLAIPALFALSACATKADVRDLRESILELSAQQNAILRDIQVEQEAQSDSLRALQRGIQDFRAETLRRIMIVEDQLLRTQELAGLSQQELARMRDQLDRDRAAAAFGAGGGFPTGDAGGGGGSAAEIFTAAVDQRNTGGLTAARMGFQDIVIRFPNDPLAPEARFYLADILEQEGDREGALAGFLEIAEYHPSAQTVPNALYRAANLYRDLGNREEARTLYERVVNTWPESPSAALAADGLRNLR